LRFSCGARSAFNLKEQGYLKSMLSRRQLRKALFGGAFPITLILAVASHANLLTSSMHRE
jgi:formate/nitrite transporter FocA (FNT family)